MGHLREKYTKTYFTGQHPDGTSAGYGLEGNYAGNETILRDFDIQILEKINFKEMHVFEIGFGRGESIKYLFEQGIASYLGIDFAVPAYDLACEYIENHNLQIAKIYCSDAIEFLYDHADKIANKINVVIMLDVIEHIPRHEASLILALLKKHLDKRAIIVINTPVYKYDNDIITNGIDERNHIDRVDHSDFIPETKGMHCNKYSIISLQAFMHDHGYLAITENHIFVHDEESNIQKDDLKLTLPYAKLWEYYYNSEYPIKKQYVPDALEYAYINKQPIKYLQFEFPPLTGIRFFGNESILDGFKHDEVLPHFEQYIKPGDIVFDVGSFVGITGLYFSTLVQASGKVICFEPNKYNMLRAKSNLSLNLKLMDNIYLYNIGLSNNESDAEMLMSDNIESGHSSASQLVKGGKIAIPQTELENLGFFKETIRLKTLDIFVNNTGLIPNVIKIDIEGAEPLLLQGGINTLKQHKPILFIEIHNVFACHMVIQLLQSLNYQLHVLSEEWGNRIQLMALYHETTQIALSNVKYIEHLVQTYVSYKAKLYQENLEKYARNQQLQHQALKDDNAALVLQYQALKEENTALQSQKQTTQDENTELFSQVQARKDENAALQSQNQTLKNENTALFSQYQALKEENTELSFKKSQLIDAVEDLKKSYSALLNSKSMRLIKFIKSFLIPMRLLGK